MGSPEQGLWHVGVYVGVALFVETAKSSFSPKLYIALQTAEFHAQGHQQRCKFQLNPRHLASSSVARSPGIEVGRAYSQSSPHHLAASLSCSHGAWKPSRQRQWVAVQGRDAWLGFYMVNAGSLVCPNQPLILKAQDGFQAMQSR